MIVRKAQPEDFAAIARLFYETIHYINAQDYTPEQLNAWAPRIYAGSHWQDRAQRLQVYVAEAEAQVVGFAELESTGHIDCFYVHHQWLRQGVGSQLMARLEAEASTQEIDRLFAEVSITARPFFEHQGFQVEREQEKRYSDVLFRQFVMSKSLGANADNSASTGILDRLEDAISNLWWTSETDHPWSIWNPQVSAPLTPEQLLNLTEHPPETPITTASVTDFLEPATQHQDWYGDEEVAIKQQYQRLLEILQTELTDLQVFKVGGIEQDIYVVGHTSNQELLGITTKAVET